MGSDRASKQRNREGSRVTCRDSPNGELARALSPQPSTARRGPLRRRVWKIQHVKFLVLETGCGSEKGSD